MRSKFEGFVYPMLAEIDEDSFNTLANEQTGSESMNLVVRISIFVPQEASPVRGILT